jgi:G:T/U-mismatch repair DNA glycosylase
MVLKIDARIFKIDARIFDIDARIFKIDARIRNRFWRLVHLAAELRTPRYKRLLDDESLLHASRQQLRMQSIGWTDIMQLEIREKRSPMLSLKENKIKTNEVLLPRKTLGKTIRL